MKCNKKKCDGIMQAGKALENTFNKDPNDPANRGSTINYAGSGKMIHVLKCVKCGHSIKRV